MTTMAIGATGLRDVGRRPAQARPRPAHGEGPLTLTARGRAVVVLLALVLVGVLAMRATGADAEAPEGALAVTTHVVASGETLWAIAAGVADPGEDVRDVVLELQRLNRLPSAGLMAGQSIVVPAQG
ncbi:LysM peptidoglycan-binding domain-containing protein [Cellulomonas soli]|uniref:LysM peptidoglycan-binding domain-containing protein n=1 Tax=Cellulomonas soli TaxID=931535 RepID=UPI003F834C86